MDLQIKVRVTPEGECTFTVDGLHYVLLFATINGMTAVKKTKHQGSHLYAGCELIYMPHNTANEIYNEYQQYLYRQNKSK